MKTLRNLFPKRKKKSSKTTGISTAPLSDLQLSELEIDGTLDSTKQLVTGIERNIGLVRANNEDTVYKLTTALDTNKTSLNFGIFMVADGMGGHKNGALASEYCVRTMAEHLIQNIYFSLAGPDKPPPSTSLQDILREGIQKADKTVGLKAPGGGTTLTAAVLIGNQLTIAHVGDSRAYAIYPDGRINTLTADHSVVSRLVELGHLSAEEAKDHPRKSMLYNSIGQGETPRPDIFTINFPYPGHLLLCSDGLWGEVEDDDIVDIVNQAPNPQKASYKLVEAAIKNGGGDNIAIVLTALIEQKNIKK
jgi:serine/threonine protein phosphatase PrpC